MIPIVWTRRLTWTAGFLAFPLAGVVGLAVVDRVDDPLPAFVGGLAAGAVIGARQWLASRHTVGEPLPWIGASAAGVAAGLLAGAHTVDDGTSPGELALMGAITGLPLGSARARVLRQRWSQAWIWALSIPPMWALGWTVTSAIPVDVERQCVVFGSAGAITVKVRSGLVLEHVRNAGPAVRA